MATFRYRAVTSLGRIRTGRMDAANIADLETRLKRLTLDLIDGAAVRARTGWRSRSRRIPAKDLITFCIHMAQVTRAGISVLDGLGDLVAQAEHPGFRAVLANVTEAIRTGTSVADALSAHPATFDKTFIALVRAGELSGTLPSVFEKLATQLKWRDELRANTRRLMTYPTFGLTIILGVFFFLMVYLVPQLAGFIRSMSGGHLPVQTALLLAMSGFITHQWYWILAAVALLAMSVILTVKFASEALKLRIDGIKLKVPLLGPILRKIVLVRFASTLALLYAANIPVLQAMDLSAGVLNNRLLIRAVTECRAQIAEGRGITESFESTGLFPSLILRMLRIGEKTGELDKSLANVGYFYDREIAESMNRVQALIEPILTVFMGSILGWLILAMLGPLYDTISKTQF
jgi:type IV pilus assembly protein PilC